MSQASTLAVGSKVGRYSLAAEAPEALAATCFVGRAEDGRLARVLLLPRAGTDADAVQRAAAQAKNLAHPSVLRLSEVEPADGRLAVSFEHADGVSLQTLVAAAGAGGLSRGVALRITLDVLDGLAAAHAAGLVHGELGPHLVLVGADGRARILGAGVAKALGKALAPKTSSDRLAYIASERVKGASSGSAPAADPKCDVFSAAVMAWELFAKQRLFAGRLESAVVQKVLTGQVAPLAAMSDDVPDDVDEALKKALERDPVKRMATAKELAQALEAALADVAATHEEVGRVVEDLGKKPLAELRARLAEAGATSATGELVVPPARPSFPTLDELWVESADDPPKPPPKPAAKAPPPPPKAAAKPAVIVPGAKPAVPGAGSAEVKLAVPAAAVKIEAKDAKPADAKVEAKAADAPEAKADGADGRGAAEKADAKVETPAAPGVKAGGIKVPAKAGLSIPRAGALGGAAKKAPEPRKATLLGLAAPIGKVEAAPKPGIAKPESEPQAKADAGEKAADVKAAGAEASAEAAAKADAEAAIAKAEASAEASAPASTTPTLHTGMKPPGEKAAAAAKVEASEAKAASEAKSAGDPEPTPASSTPSSSGGGLPLSEKKKLPGTLKPGDTLGRYELLLPVAAGGMATVWAARLEGTAGFQKTVAIKTMLPGLSSDVDFEEMFLDEARVAARIRHPNVVEIFDLGEEGETLYLVMEWVDGETVGALQKQSKAHGGVPMPILLRLASQACAGLHAAHELRDDKGALVDLVHRDISPANILVSRTGFVKIVDFGVAKSKARMYTTRVGGMIKGKTPYLSPEQLAAQPIDRRSDIFSFGAVLYVLATGLHPFRGENDSKTIENIALRDPVSLRKLDPSIPAEFEAIVLKALAKEREKRWETASEMQRAIDTLAASIGQTVNDDDVAAFVRKVAGDGLEKRGAALRDAIAAADAGKPPVQPRSAQSPESSRDVAAAASNDDAMKVDIDDIEVDAGDGAAPKSSRPAAAAKSGGAPSPLAAIPPPPPASSEDVGALPPLTAPSLGSDSAPDTLAAASTEGTEPGEIAPPKKRGPLLVVGGVLGLGAIIGVIALASGGGDPPPERTGSAATSAVTGAEMVRTGEASATAAAPATQAPAATEAPAATAAATATAEPSAAPDTTAAPDPTPSAAAAGPPIKSQPLIKPAPQTKPVTVAKPPPKTVTKPPKKFEPSGL